MIIDTLINAEKYQSSAKLKQGFDFIKENNLLDKEPGVYELSHGLKAIIAEYETKAISECVIESHQKYIDIQYVIKGIEQIGYTPLLGQKPTTPYSVENDVVFYKEDVSLFTLSEGMFAIFYPEDIHMPGANYKDSSLVKKLVIKVPVE